MIARLNNLKHKTELILAVSVAMAAVLIIWIIYIFPNRQEIWTEIVSAPRRACWSEAEIYPPLEDPVAGATGLASESEIRQDSLTEGDSLSSFSGATGNASILCKALKHDRAQFLQFSYYDWIS